MQTTQPHHHTPQHFAQALVSPSADTMPVKRFNLGHASANPHGSHPISKACSQNVLSSITDTVSFGRAPLASSAASSGKLFQPLTPVRFGSQISPTQAQQLFEQFGISPQNITVAYGANKCQTPTGSDAHLGTLSAKEIEDALAHYLSAHRLALQYQEAGNLKGDYYATHTQLADGTWGAGVNIVLSPTQVLCSERASVTNAFSRQLEQQAKQATRPQPTQAAGFSAPKATQVKNLILSTVNLGEGLTPCSDCMSWLNTELYFQNDTRILNIVKNPKTPTNQEKQPDTPPQYTLWVRTLQDLLPHRGRYIPSTTSLPIEALPIQRSNSANSNSVSFSNQHIIQLLKKAQKDHDQSQPGKFTASRLSASALFSDGRITTDSRFEWHKRLVESADLNAVGKGFRPRPTWKKLLSAPITTLWTRLMARIRNSTQRPPTTLQALAYYGFSRDEVPDIRSLGYLAKQQHGSPDVLVLTIENDTIQVRTIRDYLPELYISATDKPAPFSGA